MIYANYSMPTEAEIAEHMDEPEMYADPEVLWTIANKEGRITSTKPSIARIFSKNFTYLLS